MGTEALHPTPEFLAAAERAGVAFDPGDVERLGRFLALLLETNRVMNLTAITEPAEAWRKHVLDALTLLPVLAELGEGREAGSGPMRVIDVGSGGGVPGIPLAVCMPEVRFTLLEPTGKKAAFLARAVGDEAAGGLGLKNVEVVCDRAERIGRDTARHREGYDAAVVRAVGPLAVIAELAGPLVKVGGVMLAIKGAKAEEELEAARGALAAVGLEHDRTIETQTGRVVVLSKTARTPRAYPRVDGEPKRKPLA